MIEVDLDWEREPVRVLRVRLAHAHLDLPNPSQPAPMFRLDEWHGEIPDGPGCPARGRERRGGHGLIPE